MFITFLISFDIVILPTYLPFNRFNIGENLLSLIFIDLPLSFLIELPIFWFFFNYSLKFIGSNLTKISLVKLVLLANLASYMFLASHIVYISIYTPDDSPSADKTERSVSRLIGVISRSQQMFHFERHYFASSFDELEISLPEHLGIYKYPSTILKQIGPSVMDSNLYQISMYNQKTQNIITGNSKNPKYRNMTNTLIYDKNQYFQVICLNNKNNLIVPPAEFINGE